jgi:hypothetical protein
MRKARQFIFDTLAQALAMLLSRERATKVEFRRNYGITLLWTKNEMSNKEMQLRWNHESHKMNCKKL